MYSSGGAAYHAAFQWAVFPTGTLSLISRRWDTVRGFIAFPLSGVLLSSRSVLSLPAYGDPSSGLAPLINPACHVAEAHLRDWLPRRSGALIGSAAFFVREELDCELTPAKFPSTLRCFPDTHRLYTTCAQTGGAHTHASPVSTASLQISYKPPACKQANKCVLKYANSKK